MKQTMKYLSIAALVAVGAIMMGCNKLDIVTEQTQQEEEPVISNTVTLTTTVSLDAATKALTAAGVKTFAAGETMALVYKNPSSATVKVVSAALTDGDIASGSKTATFTFELTDPDRTQNVTYIYPAAMANADGTVNYDALATQNGTLATLSSSLDLATKTAAWDAGSLPTATLENQLAILALTLKNSTGSSDLTSTITGVTLSDGTNNYTVTRSAAAGPIYVAIRPTSSANIQITATNGTANYVKSLTGKTYAASNGYNVSWKMILTGAFTINSSGTQVYFAPGNLQATYDGTSWSWAFAANQWDYIGNAAGNTSINGNGTVSASNVTVDLFGWVGASSNWWGAAQYGISNSTATNSTNGYGNNASEALKSDWGYTIGSGWRTLTSAEWQYIFNTRTSGSTVFGTSSARYAHATINTDGTSVNGMILFPDGASIASTEVTTAGSVNATSAYATKCTTAQWAALAAKGCVFLPAAGYRSEASVSGAGSYGLYWSSSPYTSSVHYAYYVNFHSDSLGPAGYDNRDDGYSVRLVRQVE